MAQAEATAVAPFDSPFVSDPPPDRAKGTPEQSEGDERLGEIFNELENLLAKELDLGKIEMRQEKRGVVITLDGSVLFASGKHELLPIARQRLDQVAKALKDQGFKKIVVEGHTDSANA